MSAILFMTDWFMCAFSKVRIRLVASASTDVPNTSAFESVRAHTHAHTHARTHVCSHTRKCRRCHGTLYCESGTCFSAKAKWLVHPSHLLKAIQRCVVCMCTHARTHAHTHTHTHTHTRARARARDTTGSVPHGCCAHVCEPTATAVQVHRHGEDHAVPARDPA